MTLQSRSNTLKQRDYKDAVFSHVTIGLGHLERERKLSQFERFCVLFVIIEFKICLLIESGTSFPVSLA